MQLFKLFNRFINKLVASVNNTRPDNRLVNKSAVFVDDTKLDNCLVNEPAASVDDTRPDNCLINEPAASVNNTRPDNCLVNEPAASVDDTKPDNCLVNEPAASVNDTRLDHCLVNKPAASVDDTKPDNCLVNEPAASVDDTKLDNCLVNEPAASVNDTRLDSTESSPNDEQYRTDFPQSDRQARQHIEDIQNAKMKGSSLPVAEDCENALDLICNNLFSSPVRFIIELLQNADDNSYADSVTPKVWITYRDGALQFDTNETGFRRTDVEAICSLGKSPKKVETSEKKVAPIGEKGIGFKAVFKFADEVFINSGFYSFKFTNEKKVPLGRLTPFWADFPGDCSEGLTSILLKFRKDVDQWRLIEDVKKLDAKLLMFLNKVDEVEIVLSKPHDSVDDYRVILRREDGTDPVSQFPLRTLVPDASSPYIVSRYQVSNLPHEETRKGHDKSELILAFPRAVNGHPMELLEESKPTKETHNVYAFLPIRNYGFKFILQGDFVLTANRQEIDSVCQWNAALRDSIPTALLDFVTRLNASNMRYYWPLLFPIRTETDDFFQSVWTEVVRAFSRGAIIEANGGKLALPSELWLLPKKFCESTIEGTTREPLIPSGFSKFTCVSPKYPSTANTGLESLGVNIFSAHQFLEDLSNFISSHPEKFQTMPRDWHSQLSGVLDSLTADYKEMIASLRFIALRDGTWIAPKDGPLLFPLQGGSLVIPEKIGHFIVRTDLAEDCRQKLLLLKLGARKVDKEWVCRAIIKTHASKQLTPNLIEMDELIRHAEFLYLAGWRCQEVKDDLWVAVEDGSYCRSAHVYLKSTIPYSASQVFAEHHTKFSFLHAEYFRVFNTREHQDWLKESLKLAVFPRLVNPYDDGEKFELNPDFRFVIQNVATLEVLQLLKTNWEYYKCWVVPKKDDGCKIEPKEMPNEKIKAAISSMKVNCRYNRSARLDQTCLPREDILLAFAMSEDAGVSTSNKFSFQLLPIPDPTSPDWDFLEQFNVVVKVQAKHLIRRLQEIKECSEAMEKIPLLYKGIENCTVGKEDELIRREFQEKKLLFIPAPTSSWVDLEHSVWSGPNSLRKVHFLKEHYPELELLFRRTLGIRPATVKTLIAEAKEITSNDPLPYIFGLLQELSCQLHKIRTLRSDDGWDDLKCHSIFPVSTGQINNTFEYLGAASGMAQANEWYIADSSFWRESFEGRIPLLVLDPLQTKSIEDLIHYVGCDNRKLSRLVKRSCTIGGSAMLDGEYTASLQRKWKYIASLIPTSNPERMRLSRQLQRVQVVRVQNVSVVWKLCKDFRTTVEGRREDGTVMLDADINMLKIYLKESKATIGHPPLHLIKEIQDLCGITQEFSLHLSHILMSNSFQEIEDYLHRDGLLDNISQYSMADSEAINNLVSKNPAAAGLATVHTSSRDILNNIDLNSEPAISSLREIIRKSPPPTSNSTTQNARSLMAVRSGSSTSTAVEHLRGDSSMHSMVAFPNPTAVWSHVLPSERVKDDRRKTRWNTARSGLVSLHIPSLVSLPDVSANQFLAELLVNDILSGVLRDAYAAQQHWTSTLRSRAGHKPIESADADSSTFTLVDTSSRLKEFLERQRGPLPLAANSKFHIEVIFSTGPVSGGFFMNSAQIAMAKELSFTNKNDQVYAEVFVLAFVFNLHTDPVLALFVDPWQMKRNGTLYLEPILSSRVSFRENTPVLYVRCGGELSNVSGSCGEQKMYRYHDLKHREIRVLQLLPGKDDEPIECSIRHISINHDETFWAISYPWGRAIKGRAPIYITTPQGNISIGLSLYSVLRVLREKMVKVPIWVDAVCINQANPSEKVRQILLMRQIFQKSALVVAWLGEEYGRSREVLETILQIRCRSQMPESSLGGGNTGTASLAWSDKVPDEADKFWEDINLLLQREWFMRVWIVQELVLPSKVMLMCGRHSEADWDHFFEGLTICERVLNAKNSQDSDNVKLIRDAGPAFALGLARKKLRSNEIQFSLIELLELFAHTEATDEVDKLFALLGLAEDADHPLFKPDYGSSIEEIVRRYAKAFVSNGQSMDLLYRAGASKSYQCCSWIPRWTHGEFPKTISTWDAVEGFHAGWNVHPVVEIRNGNYLSVGGYVVDKIQHTSSFRLGSDWELYCAASLARLRRLVQFYAPNYPTGETVEDLLVRLPIGNARRPHLETGEHRLRGFRSFPSESCEGGTWPSCLRSLVLGLGVKQNTERYIALSPASRNIISQFWLTAEAFSSRLGDAVFCGTERRYVGLVPDAAREGDQICLLHGGRVPFLLRPKANGVYRLVGEAYIHGIMQGQAFRQVFQPSTFLLS
ncbi:hypothetical protein F5B21DRAFT_500471 [Xylaria acuta]|nr:hypothetical protein F5B21DRAFT_500471 [Xylaria acuta]